jgi:hypothetical protein
MHTCRTVCSNSTRLLLLFCTVLTTALYLAALHAINLCMHEHTPLLHAIDGAVTDTEAAAVL